MRRQEVVPLGFVQRKLILGRKNPIVVLPADLVIRISTATPLWASILHSSVVPLVGVTAIITPGPRHRDRLWNKCIGEICRRAELSLRTIRTPGTLWHRRDAGNAITTRCHVAAHVLHRRVARFRVVSAKV